MTYRQLLDAITEAKRRQDEYERLRCQSFPKDPWKADELQSRINSADNDLDTEIGEFS